MTSCSNGVGQTEVNHINGWKDFTKGVQDGTQAALPVTAMLVAMHNMVTETVPSDIGTSDRKKLYCPATVFAQFKSGLFASDATVQAYALPTYGEVDGVPGLDSDHASVTC